MELSSELAAIIIVVAPGSYNEIERMLTDDRIRCFTTEEVARAAEDIVFRAAEDMLYLSLEQRKICSPLRNTRGRNKIALNHRFLMPQFRKR